MTLSDFIFDQLEALKVPMHEPECPEDWKDWYHYILFDPDTGIRLLINVSLLGRPGKGDIGNTVFLSIPDKNPPYSYKTYGYSESCIWTSRIVKDQPLQISLAHFNFILNAQKTARVTGNHIKSQIEYDLTIIPKATPIHIPEFFPFGADFIGWGLVPGMTVEGFIRLGSRIFNINANWFCYHDRNYGRFRWGKNVGWVWWVATLYTTEQVEITYIFSRSQNSNLTEIRAPVLFIYENGHLSKMFFGDMIDLQIDWNTRPEKPVILPGTMASLFGDRHVLMPRRISMYAADDYDNAFLQLEIDLTTELILPDYQEKQYTFLKELSGKPIAALKLRNKAYKFKRKGFFYAEFVH